MPCFTHFPVCGWISCPKLSWKPEYGAIQDIYYVENDSTVEYGKTKHYSILARIGMAPSLLKAVIILISKWRGYSYDLAKSAARLCVLGICLSIQWTNYNTRSTERWMGNGRAPRFPHPEAVVRRLVNCSGIRNAPPVKPRQFPNASRQITISMLHRIRKDIYRGQWYYAIW